MTKQTKNNNDVNKAKKDNKVKAYTGLFDVSFLDYHNSYIANGKKKQTAMLIGFILNLLGVGFTSNTKKLALMIAGIRSNVSYTKDNKDNITKAFTNAINTDVIDITYLIKPDKSYLDKAINNAKDINLYADVFNSKVKSKALQWLCDDADNTSQFYASTIALIAKITKQKSTDVKASIKKALLDKKYDNNNIAQIIKKIA